MTWRSWPPLLLAVVFGASTFGAFVISSTVGLFDVNAHWEGWRVWAAAASEIGRGPRRPVGRHCRRATCHAVRVSRGSPLPVRISTEAMSARFAAVEAVSRIDLPGRAFQVATCSTCPSLVSDEHRVGPLRGVGPRIGWWRVAAGEVEAGAPRDAGQRQVGGHQLGADHLHGLTDRGRGRGWSLRRPAKARPPATRRPRGRAAAAAVPTTAHVRRRWTRRTSRTSDAARSPVAAGPRRAPARRPAPAPAGRADRPAPARIACSRRTPARCAWNADRSTGDSAPST